MRATVSKYDFERAFIDAGRENNFSYAGRNALFDYLEEYEEIELDVVALCCEFTEYENIEEFVANYDDSYVVWDTEPDPENDEPGEVDYEATLDNIRDRTEVIDVDGESFIIQDF